MVVADKTELSTTVCIVLLAPNERAPGVTPGLSIRARPQH
jgi:hypothetical protein